MPLYHVKTRSKRSGHRNVRELQGSTSGHRVGPRSSVAGVIRPNYGIRSASSVSHRRDMSRYGLFSPCTAFPVRVIPRRQLADAASCTIRRRPYGGIAPRGALLRGVSTRGKSPRKSACEVIMGSTMSSYLDRKRPLPLSKSLPRAAYRTAVRSFLLYHFF